MSIALKHTGTGQTILLSDRLDWTDEFDRSSVASEARWGTTGALMLHVGLKQAGQPITLDGVQTEAWITRAECQQLQAWAQQPGQTFELTLRGQHFTVSFDHAQGSAFRADPIWRLLDGEHTPELLYRPTFHFIEV